MKILLLGDPNSPHVIKWAKSLNSLGVTIYIYGLSSCDEKIYSCCNNVTVKTLGVDRNFVRKPNRSFSKIIYLRALKELKALLSIFKPDILHAHYATSYALIGALSHYRPLIISLWGSDVFEFPRKSFFHKYLLRYNLGAADVIFSTSEYMATEAYKYTDRQISITPFGIDTKNFYPTTVKSLFDPGAIIIGTVKHLEHIYGIDCLLRSFKITIEQNPGYLLKLMIVGGGSQENYLKRLSQDLGISKDVVFIGKVGHNEVNFYHNMLSIAVYLSREESFGVSVLESAACGKPVVVSNVGGFTEIVKDNCTGFIVPKDSPLDSAKAISRLIRSDNLRIEMGNAGLAHVKSHYNWEDNIREIMLIYNKVLAQKNNF